MRPWVMGCRIRQRCGQNLLLSVTETWFCPDRDTLGVSRLELSKLLKEHLLSGVEALPAGQVVHPVNHMLTWESSFGLRFNDEDDNALLFEPFYCCKFSNTSLNALLNLYIFLPVNYVDLGQLGSLEQVETADNRLQRLSPTISTPLAISTLCWGSYGVL